MIIFTAVPPPSRWNENKIKGRAEEIIGIVEGSGLKTINVPEVPEKVSPIEFSRILKGIKGEIDVIIDKVVPKNWGKEIEEIFREISNLTGKLALVKIGENSNLVGLAKGYFREIYGITIFTRKGEDLRLFNRTVWGFDAFISQIIFETESLRKTLENYYELCRRNGVKPARIFVSVAPAKGERDIRFLEGFRVEIPEDIKEEILMGNGLEVAKRLAEEVLSMPWNLGINVEHVMMDNLELAGELLRCLANRRTQNYTNF